MKKLVENGLKLGFGLMRLPTVEDDSPMNGGQIDIDHTKKMVDEFIAAGGNYFDTAFVYKGSEEAAKEALISRYPRESFYLATKLNAGFAANTEEEAKSQFNQSLEKSGAGYFDFYLLHALSGNNIKKYEDFHLWDFVKELKEEGKIKHYGFSWHGTAADLDTVLTNHPDAEFVQLQINYVDWEDVDIQSRACYEVCERHDKPVIVMEPVKGGTLAALPKAASEIFKDVNPNLSDPSWAIRYAASLDNVFVVLSGMSNMDQMKDNLSFMKDFKPLSQKEQEAVLKVVDKLKEIRSIACTNCKYCVSGCPQGINIPKVFALMNHATVYDALEKCRKEYGWRIGEHKASGCIACGKCEGACPQHLPIIEHLKECARALE